MDIFIYLLWEHLIPFNSLCSLWIVSFVIGYVFYEIYHTATANLFSKIFSHYVCCFFIQLLSYILYRYFVLISCGSICQMLALFIKLSLSILIYQRIFPILITSKFVFWGHTLMYLFYYSDYWAGGEINIDFNSSTYRYPASCLHLSSIPVFPY